MSLKSQIRLGVFIMLGLLLSLGSYVIFTIHRLESEAPTVQQTNARLYRQGQAEPVTITHLTATGTLDQAVLKALEAKDMTQAALIDAVATELTTISRKESSCM